MTRFSLPASGDSYDIYPKTLAADALEAETMSVNEDPESWRVVWHNLMRSRGLEPSIGALLAKYLEDVGLQDVKVKRFVLPFGTWEGMADAQRRMAPIHEAFVRDDAPVLIRRLGITGSMSSEEVDRVIEDLNMFVEGFREIGSIDECMSCVEGNHELCSTAVYTLGRTAKGRSSRHERNLGSLKGIHDQSWSSLLIDKLTCGNCFW